MCIYFIGDIMSQTVYAYFLSTIAGMSTLIGTVLIFIKKINKNKFISKCLFFSSGVMLYVSFFDLIPESFNIFTSIFYLFPSIILLLIFLVLGIITSSFIERKVNNKNSLYKIGIVSMIAIILHNIPEGIITFLSYNTSVGTSLLIAIALHNIPEGISISIPIFYSTNSKLKAFFYTFISGLSEPFGALIAHIFLSNLNTNIMCYLFAFTAGIMIQISVFELIKEAHKLKEKGSVLYLFLGIFLMYLSHLITK